MKNIILIVLTIIYLPVYSQDPIMHRIQDTTRSQSGWYYGKSTDGNFSVELPIPFNDFTMVVENVHAYIVGSKSIEKIKFSVTEMNRKKRKRINLNLNRLVPEIKEPNATISNISKCRTKNFKSIYFELKNNNVGSFIKYIYTKKKIFTLIIEYPITEEQTTLKVKDYFFDSFKIINN